MREAGNDPRSYRVDFSRARKELGFEAAWTIPDGANQLAKEYRESDQVDATYDPEYGFPTSVSVDRIRNAIDDEWGFGVSDFVPK